jgi:hypothetical protein
MAVFIAMDGMYAGFAGAKTRAALAKGIAIRCELRLALDADRPTERNNITLNEH